MAKMRFWYGSMVCKFDMEDALRRERWFDEKKKTWWNGCES